ncbi:MAG: 2-(3-amino-3-carboxypropyl)histidine synthase subunit 1/2 [Ignisphaera sp.]|nr:2-(3-amino-3-carboxypropyl)histidine synthase subunit 1/2 [Ignisphaera sp.]MCX8168451.1 2-(3-amino-3-carboxypropyl)histidine synthase subunit 1/2 [Ignisphaera sp.]MDW8085109.1 2-(3-amino-3-carboxypropyl)histidine synthase subunit 1/2 [Ignisphaera sp.]
MEFCESFDFEIEKIVDTIRSRDVRRIYIQLPEGFQRCTRFITDRIRVLLGRDVEVFISANPSYGSCLVDEYGAKSVNAQLIVHFGHTPYPYQAYNADVLFIPVEYTGADLSRILGAIGSLCLEENVKLCLAASPQHINLVKSICSAIERCKCTFRGVVMGCYPVASENCDVLVVVSGGKFHCITQALFEYRKGFSSSSSKILCLDPYSYSLWDPSKEAEKMVKIRMWKIFQAANAKRWLIIDGFYGQNRENLLVQLTKLLGASNREYHILKALKLDRETLINVGADSNFDAIVVTSCPYLVFDFNDFDKPILTIGEAFAVLNGDTNRYVYPW